MADISENTERLRSEAAFLLSQARQQSFDLQRALAAVTDDGTLQSRLAAAAAQLSGAIGRLSEALGSSSFPLRAADIAALESVVSSGEAGHLVSEAEQAATNAARMRNLTTATVATRREVQSLSHDLFDGHLFDPYLSFSSAEEEENYRKRQAEARKYIDEQLARGTPEGSLNAAGCLQGSMLEAHAHGAGNSPEFMPRFTELAATARNQRAAMQAAGQSTAEYDRNVTASVRRFLKAERHLSDAEIDKILAGSADPLDAVKPFLSGDHASQRLEDKIDLTTHSAPPAVAASLPRVEATQEAPMKDSETSIDFSAMDAKLRAAGLQPSSGNTDSTGHGLGIAKPAAKDGQSIGS